MEKKKVKRIIADTIVGIGFLLLVIAILMFLILNKGVFFSSVAMGIIWMLMLAILPVMYAIVEKYKWQENRGKKWIALGLLLIDAITLLLCIYYSSIADFVQPIVLNSMVQVLLIVSSVILLIAALCEMLSNRSLVSIAVSAMLLMTMFTGIIWANAEGYKPFNENVIQYEKSVFKNGEEGYVTFRIPSIVALDHNVINAKVEGASLEHDILLATAEGRKNSSHDTGSIDMVGKVSRDGGKTWSRLIKIYSYDKEVGKYGNPTPVLDSRTGKLILPYMTATAANNYNSSTFVAICPIDKDGNITFPPVEEHVDISFEKGAEESAGSDGVRSYTLMVGPGKSIQLTHGDKAGRLVIPASSGGKSFVMYNDDDPAKKADWKKGESAGEGNECEVVELDDGELCMVVRDNMGCCSNHFKQYQRLSYSDDGGETWYAKTKDTELRSPICMSSVDRLTDGTMLMTYPDSFYTRVNLTIAASTNDGKSFKRTWLYAGPAGYSCMTVDTSDNIFVLAEIGKVDYNEKLILLKVDSRKLAK